MLYPEDSPPLFSLTSGPVEIYPEVLRAMSRRLPFDFDPAYQAFYERVTDKLARAMRTTARPLILQADPVLGAEAAAASLIAPGDTVLNLVSGVYGKAFGDFARRHAGDVHEIEVPFNEVIEPDAVRRHLARHPEVSLVSLVHHDTPSGTVNPAAEIAVAVKEAGALFLVDATSSFGGMAVWPEAVLADVFITGSSKCLGAPPGLTLMHVSDAGWRRIEANPGAPRGSILSILDWRHAGDRDQPFPFTTSGAEIHALDAALDLYLDEGEEAVWQRHARTAAAFRAAVAALGLDLWPARAGIASPTCTAIRVPDGLSDADILAAVRRHSGIAFAGGRGAIKGRVMRVGHMGRTAYPAFAFMAATALAGGLRALGVAAPAGDALEAAMAELE